MGIGIPTHLIILLLVDNFISDLSTALHENEKMLGRVLGRAVLPEQI